MGKIKTCIVCGKTYEYCGHCDKGGQENRWKTNYCSENCRDIFDIVSKYVNKNISTEDAKKDLLEKNLGVVTKTNIVNYCNEIISYTEVKSEEDVLDNIEKSVDDVSDDTEVSINETPVKDEQEFTSFSETNSKFKRKRRHVLKSEE